jgi:hypothetical protein
MDRGFMGRGFNGAMIFLWDPWRICCSGVLLRVFCVGFSLARTAAFFSPAHLSCD